MIRRNLGKSFLFLASFGLWSIRGITKPAGEYPFLCGVVHHHLAPRTDRSLVRGDGVADMLVR